jgi:hypothetical protein
MIMTIVQNGDYDDYYDEDEEIRNYHYQLGRAKFTAVNLVKGGRHITVELGQVQELFEEYESGWVKR